MPTNEEEPNGPWGQSTETWAPVYKFLNTVLFVLAMILMCICETIVIHGLWFKPQPSISRAKLFLKPLSVLYPGLFGFAMRVEIGRQSKKGQISLRAAATLDGLLCLLLLFSYMAMVDFADLAF